MAASPRLRQDVFNVKDYGARGDGTTDDTAAIQAALDAAGLVRGRVQIPGSATAYRFSNLKIPAYVSLVGNGMQSTILKRTSGATGTAIREKTADEGNTYGATGIWIRDLHVDGNATSGDGINLGNQVGSYPMASGSGMAFVFSWNFPSGTAITLCSNAETYFYLWGVSSQDGILLNGSGGNQYFGLYAEANSRYQLYVNEPYATLYGIHIETAVASSDPVILQSGANNSLSGIFISHTGATSKAALILNSSGKNNNIYRDVQIIGSGTFTHGIKNETWGTGTGTDTRIYEYLVSTNTTGSSWYINGSTGKVVTRAADLTDLGAIEVNNTQLGFYGTAAASKPTVTGSRGSNAALASLLAALSGLGLLTDSSS